MVGGGRSDETRRKAIKVHKKRRTAREAAAVHPLGRRGSKSTARRYKIRLAAIKVGGSVYDETCLSPCCCCRRRR